MRWLPLVVLGVALALLGATERAAAQTAPGAPTIDAVAGTTNTLTVIWSAPSDDGGATISAYHLRYTEGDPHEPGRRQLDLPAQGVDLELGLALGRRFRTQGRHRVRRAGASCELHWPLAPGRTR